MEDGHFHPWCKTTFCSLINSLPCAISSPSFCWTVYPMNWVSREKLVLKPTIAMTVDQKAPFTSFTILQLFWTQAKLAKTCTRISALSPFCMPRNGDFRYSHPKKPYGNTLNHDLAMQSSMSVTLYAFFRESDFVLHCIVCCRRVKFKLRIATLFRTFCEHRTRQSLKIATVMTRVQSSGILKSMKHMSCRISFRRSKPHSPVAWHRSFRLHFSAFLWLQRCDELKLAQVSGSENIFMGMVAASWLINTIESCFFRTWVWLMY